MSPRLSSTAGPLGVAALLWVWGLPAQRFSALPPTVVRRQSSVADTSGRAAGGRQAGRWALSWPRRRGAAAESPPSVADTSGRFEADTPAGPRPSAARRLACTVEPAAVLSCVDGAAAAAAISSPRSRLILPGRFIRSVRRHGEDVPEKVRPRSACKLRPRAMGSQWRGRRKREGRASPKQDATWHLERSHPPLLNFPAGGKF
jgi:hypothetical protein